MQKRTFPRLHIVTSEETLASFLLKAGSDKNLDLTALKDIIKLHRQLAQDYPSQHLPGQYDLLDTLSGKKPMSMDLLLAICTILNCDIQKAYLLYVAQNPALKAIAIQVMALLPNQEIQAQTQFTA